MNEQLSAIRKKIQSTKEELDRVQKELPHESPEYLLATEILHIRLKDLNQQVNGMVTKSIINPNDEDVDQSPDPFRWLIQFSIARHNPHDPVSLRSLSYFLFGFQHLLDYLVDEDLELTDKKSDLLIHFQQGSTMTLNVEIPHGMDRKALGQAAEHLIELLTLAKIKDKTPGFLVEWEPHVFSYAKKWMTFLQESDILITGKLKPTGTPSVIQNFSINSKTLAVSTQALHLIHKELSEPFAVSGVLNAMNLQKQLIEIEHPQTGEMIRARCTKNQLLQTCHDLGKMITLQVCKLLTENKETGESRTILILNK